jgi:ribosome recycling factor
MIQQLRVTLQAQMDKTLSSFKHELDQIRTGRAHPGLLENLRVTHYDSEVALKHMASINVLDAATLSITPWDASAVAAVEKAIRTSDLGLNPNTLGGVIRVTLPALTQERRLELSKLVKKIAEKGRISLRNYRQDAMKELKDCLKNKEISEDDERRGREIIQKTTDEYIDQVDKLLQAKEAELIHE